MELIVKVLLATVIVIVVLAALFIGVRSVFGGQVTEAQAESLVLSDLQNSNPGAVLNITNATPSQFAGSWHLVVSVVANATTPCPSYYIYSFDYPKYGFVYQVVNTYTKNCNIYESAVNGSYLVTSYPVAITRVTTLNVSQVNSYIGTYGFGNVKTSAAYYNSTEVETNAYHDVWVVDYSAAKANYTISALITRNGAYVAAYNLSR